MNGMIISNPNFSQRGNVIIDSKDYTNIHNVFKNFKDIMEKYNWLISDNQSYSLDVEGISIFDKEENYCINK